MRAWRITMRCSEPGHRVTVAERFRRQASTIAKDGSAERIRTGGQAGACAGVRDPAADDDPPLAGRRRGPPQRAPIAHCTGRGSGAGHRGRGKRRACCGEGLPGRAPRAFKVTPEGLAAPSSGRPRQQQGRARLRRPPSPAPRNGAVTCSTTRHVTRLLNVTRYEAPWQSAPPVDRRPTPEAGPPHRPRAAGRDRGVPP
jgi:hypothetical protein